MVVGGVVLIALAGATGTALADDSSDPIVNLGACAQTVGSNDIGQFIVDAATGVYGPNVSPVTLMNAHGNPTGFAILDGGDAAGVYCGGTGITGITKVAGADSLVIGGSGITVVEDLADGTFAGNVVAGGTNIVLNQTGGVLNGGSGINGVLTQSGGVFNGGDGGLNVVGLITSGFGDEGDTLRVTNAIAEGTNGLALIDLCLPPVPTTSGTFNGGGNGATNVVLSLASGVFNGGSGANNLVLGMSGGTFTGGDGVLQESPEGLSVKVAQASESAPPTTNTVVKMTGDSSLVKGGKYATNTVGAPAAPVDTDQSISYVGTSGYLKPQKYVHAAEPVTVTVATSDEVNGFLNWEIGAANTDAAMYGGTFDGGMDATNTVGTLVGGVFNGNNQGNGDNYVGLLIDGTFNGDCSDSIGGRIGGFFNQSGNCYCPW
jgi:hypothetical protein